MPVPAVANGRNLRPGWEALVKKATIGAAAAAILFGLTSMPASAGVRPATLVVAPEVTDQGGTVVISNSDDAASTCLPVPVPASASGPAANGDPQIALEIIDPNTDLFVGVRVTPDVDGNWSYETDTLEILGQYEVHATCQIEGAVSSTATPAAFPTFDYANGSFEVIAQTTTTVAPTSTTAAPTTTSTTAAVAAVAATPKYTG